MYEALLDNVVVSKRYVASQFPLTLLTGSRLCRPAWIDSAADSVTARNIYYKDPALFKSQQVVDRYVDILAFTLGVRRTDLNVVSSLSLHTSKNSQFDIQNRRRQQQKVS